jgi:RNA polymerase sigma-70 factor (ECF subfamily)
MTPADPVTTPGWKENFISTLAVTHGSQLIKFFISRLRDPAEAQDLAQETYLRLLRVDRLDLVRRPDVYLFTIAVNLVRERALKKASRPLQVALEDMHSDEVPLDNALFMTVTPEAEVDEAHRMRVLERTLATLSPKARAALIWHRRDGQTYEEIGARLGVSRNMVKKYLAKAVAACRKARDDEQAEGP